MDPITLYTLGQLAVKGIGALRRTTPGAVRVRGYKEPVFGPQTGTTPTSATTASTTPPAPAATATREDRDKLTWGTTGRMEGFQVGSTYGGDVKARNSVKNTFGRIASKYEAKPSSIDAILADPEFKRYFPNAKKAGFDSIDFGGVMSDFESGTPVGVVDVGAAFDANTDTGRGWWWGAGSGSTTGSTAPSMSSFYAPSTYAARTATGPVFTSVPASTAALSPQEIWNLPSATLGSLVRRY